MARCLQGVMHGNALVFLRSLHWEGRAILRQPLGPRNTFYFHPIGAFRQARWMTGRLVRTSLFFELRETGETWLARWWVGRDRKGSLSDRKATGGIEIGIGTPLCALLYKI